MDVFLKVAILYVVALLLLTMPNHQSSTDDIYFGDNAYSYAASYGYKEP